MAIRKNFNGFLFPLIDCWCDATIACFKFHDAAETGCMALCPRGVNPGLIGCPRIRAAATKTHAVRTLVWRFSLAKTAPFCWE
jgi:hypothetical protein